MFNNGRVGEEERRLSAGVREQLIDYNNSTAVRDDEVLLDTV